MTADRNVAFARLRLVLWGLVALAAIGATGLYVFRPFEMRAPGGSTLIGEAQAYAPFALQSTQGGTFSQANLTGKPSLVFFGYTHCPDVCPTTLAETALWRERLGLSPQDLQVILVSVDPGRDTLPALTQYLSGFGEGTIGLTGAPQDVERAKSAFGAYSEIVGDPSSPNYLVNHTASVYMVDAQGKFFGTIAYGESTETALGKLRRLIAAD